MTAALDYVEDILEAVEKIERYTAENADCSDMHDVELVDELMVSDRFAAAIPSAEGLPSGPGYL